MTGLRVAASPAAPILPRIAGASRTTPAFAPIGAVAVVPVHGRLVHGLPMGADEASCALIRLGVLQALAEPAVKAIALDFDCRDGEVDGCLDLAEMIFSARAQKPIWAICADHALGMGYVLAAAAARVTLPRTGTLGEVGHMAMLVDRSAQLRAAGLAVHVIASGAAKGQAARAETGGVTREDLRAAQYGVDRLGGLLTQEVARFRGIRPAVITALKGGRVMGARAVKAGLADAVLAPADAFAALSALAARRAR